MVVIVADSGFGNALQKALVVSRFAKVDGIFIFDGSDAQQQILQGILEMGETRWVVLKSVNFKKSEYRDQRAIIYTPDTVSVIRFLSACFRFGRSRVFAGIFSIQKDRVFRSLIIWILVKVFPQNLFLVSEGIPERLVLLALGLEAGIFEKRVAVHDPNIGQIDASRLLEKLPAANSISHSHFTTSSYIVIQLQVSNGSVRSKSLDREELIILARALAARLNFQIVFLGGDGGQVEEFRDLGVLPSRELITILSGSLGYVGFDSGLSHLASILGLRRAIILFDTPYTRSYTYELFGSRVTNQLLLSSPPTIDLMSGIYIPEKKEIFNQTKLEDVQVDKIAEFFSSR